MQQDSTHPTGVATAEGEKDDDTPVLAARDRKAQAALELVLEGHTWQDVATELGYPTGRAALVATERTLAKRLSMTDRGALRALAAARLEALLRPVWEKALDSSLPEFLASNKRAQELVDRWIKLVGADAPQELTIYSPVEGELDQWVAKVGGHQAKALPESDIFDLPEEDISEVEWTEEDGDAASA